MKGNHCHLPYWVRVLIGIDQLANAVMGRDPDKTISHHLGIEARKHGGTVPWSKPFEALIYRCLEWIDPGHCERSIEDQIDREKVASLLASRQPGQALVLVDRKAATELFDV